MIRFTCYIKPHRLEAVKSALANLGISGMSVSDVRGTGNSPEQTRWIGGAEVGGLPIRSKITIIAKDQLLQPMIEAVIENARTGENGDGKIFVEQVLDAVRVRTLERGDAAV